MKLFYSLLLAAYSAGFVTAAEPPAPTSATKPAAAHRADPRSAAEIHRANLLIKSFPATNPDLAKDRADIPAWWQSTLDERDAFLALRVKKGEVITYGASAGDEFE